MFPLSPALMDLVATVMVVAMEDMVVREVAMKEDTEEDTEHPTLILDPQCSYATTTCSASVPIFILPRRINCSNLNASSLTNRSFSLVARS